MNTNIYGRLDQPIYGFDPIWILTHYVAHREALIFREHNGFVAIARWIGEQCCQMADCKLVCTLIYKIGMGFTIPYIYEFLWRKNVQEIDPWSPFT